MNRFETYKYPVLGGLTGLLLAVLLISFGLFKTILVIGLVGLGVLAGLYCQRTGILEGFFQNFRR